MAKTFILPKDSFDQWRLKINEVSDKIGDLLYLETTEKSTLVGAINELNTLITDIELLYNGIQATVDDLELDIADIEEDIVTLDVKIPYPKDKLYNYGTPISGSTIELLSTLYDSHYITCPVGSLTINMTDLPVGRSVILILKGASTCTLTFPGILEFEGSIEPTYSANEDRLLIQKISASKIHAVVQGLNFL